MISDENIGAMCDFIGNRLLSYDLGWTKEGEIVTTNLDGASVFMRENHLKNLLRNDLIGEFGQVDSNAEINRLIDIIIKNCKKIAATKKQAGTEKEVKGFLGKEKVC